MWAAIIGAIIAAMGTYMNYNAQKKAARKVAQENLLAQKQRNEREKDTVDMVKKRSQDYTTENMLSEQDAIQRNLANEYLQPAMEAQAISQAAPSSQGDVSSDYLAAQSQADADVAANAKEYADILSRINAGKDWRMNEGFRIGDTAVDAGLQGNFQRGQELVNQQRLNAAAQAGSGQALMGQLMQIGGSAMMSGGFGSGGDKGLTWSQESGFSGIPKSNAGPNFQIKNFIGGK